MRRIACVILVLTCFAAIACANAGQGKADAWVKIEPFNPLAVKGEPIYFKITKFGTPFGGDYYLDGKLCKRPYMPIADGPSASDMSTPPEPLKFNTQERYYFAPLIYLCDLRLKDMESREYELCYEDPWVKGCARFQLRDPVGEDAKAYTKMSKDAHDYTDSGLSAQDIIKEYPISIYAAWVVLGDLPGAQNWRKYEPSNILRNNYSLKGEERAKAEKQANVLKSIIEDRPSFPFMTDVKIKYCQWLWTIDRKAECIENLKSWAKDKNQELATWAEKYLSAAEKIQKEAVKLR